MVIEFSEFKVNHYVCCYGVINWITQNYSIYYNKMVVTVLYGYQQITSSLIECHLLHEDLYSCMLICSYVFR